MSPSLPDSKTKYYKTIEKNIFWILLDQYQSLDKVLSILKLYTNIFAMYLKNGFIE